MPQEERAVLISIEEARARREAERNRLKPPTWDPRSQNLVEETVPNPSPQLLGFVAIIVVLIWIRGLFQRLIARLDGAIHSLRNLKKQDSGYP